MKDRNEEEKIIITEKISKMEWKNKIDVIKINLNKEGNLEEGILDYFLHKINKFIKRKNYENNSFSLIKLTKDELKESHSLKETEDSTITFNFEIKKQKNEG